ncbi:hypothetical protein EVAR_31616_1 [Eumeta japonica]|uniref:Uncharacterized protein n=1 Tax=Eumeta variegata TaxID=151549 RepID=A0A4C1W0U2_EUMVA|nr:hypothetical protein EVAR_31616_1 [Eumeta japonica]
MRFSCGEPPTTQKYKFCRVMGANNRIADWSEGSRLDNALSPRRWAGAAGGDADGGPRARTQDERSALNASGC